MDLSGYIISQFTAPGCIAQVSFTMHVHKDRSTKRDKWFKNWSAKCFRFANKMHSIDKYGRSCKI